MVLSVLGLESHVRSLTLKDDDLIGHGLDFTCQVTVSSLVLIRFVAQRGSCFREGFLKSCDLRLLLVNLKLLILFEELDLRVKISHVLS